MLGVAGELGASALWPYACVLLACATVAWLTLVLGGSVVLLGLASAIMATAGPWAQAVLALLILLEFLGLVRCFRAQAVLGNLFLVGPINLVLVPLYYVSWPVRVITNHCLGWGLTRICSLFTDNPSFAKATLAEFIRGCQVGMKAVLLGGDALTLSTKETYDKLERMFS